MVVVVLSAALSRATIAAVPLAAHCVMIATRKGNKWRQTQIDNSAAFATYSSGRKSARTFSIAATVGGALAWRSRRRRQRASL